MNESLVQWTLLNNQEYLSRFLDFNYSDVIGQEISTDFGRIDFVVKNNSDKSIVVKLETILDTKNKRD